MKVSLNWIQEYLDFALPAVNEVVEKIGAQLGAVEEVIDLGAKYKDAVVVKVVECNKLEGSDHLNVCLIDDGGNTPNVNRGENGLVQVVCGAPNVRPDVRVVWLPPGTTVPSSYGTEPFVLEARELRGVVSNGMLASAKELAVGDSHEGLLLLDNDAPVGKPFAEAYKLNDYIIDIENKMFTHRPDCFGELGVAREVAGIFNKPFKSPDWYLNPVATESGSSDAIKGLTANVEIPELCPRYMLAAIDNVKIGPSPVWLQTYLSRVGIRPINNIVDMTNYIMVLTGQPLHAFDFDKVAENGTADIVVRNPHADEQMTLLDGKTIKPRADAILITAKGQPIGLGGVMGGGNSEIDANTTRIIIESANFDMYNLRRTSMEHGIFSDAVTRFTKGQSSWQCPVVLAKAVALVKELCPDAQPVGEAVDSNAPRRENQPIPVTANFINERLGLELSAEEIAALLQNVEFQVEQQGETIQVTAPFWRTDLELREDIVEEVGRLYGFDKLPLVLPKRVINPAPKDTLLEAKTAIRDVLSRAGANEVLTYSFVHGNLLQKTTQDISLAFKLSNALSPDLQYYRLSLTPSLLEKVHPNSKAGYDQFAIFELGKTHIVQEYEKDESEAVRELNSLAFVYAAKKSVAGASYFQAKYYLETLLNAFRVRELVKLVPLSEVDLLDNIWLQQVVAPYEAARSAVLQDEKGTMWGVVGEYKISVQRQLKLPATTAGFELGPLLLMKASETERYQPLSRFPKVQQDVTLKVASNVPYQTLYQQFHEVLQSSKQEQMTLVIEPLDIYQSDQDSDSKNITLRLTATDTQKTLTDAEVNALLTTAAEKLRGSLGAERV